MKPSGYAISVTCINTGPGFACYNDSGNGVFLSPNEVSFFYNRDLKMP